MRYRHIKEGIRMGAKDLASPPKKNYTMGFEVEVAVDTSRIPEEFDGDYHHYDTNDNFESQHDDAYNRYIDIHGYPTLSTWISDNHSEIPFSEMTPRYGWVGKTYHETMEDLPDGADIHDMIRQMVIDLFENRRLGDISQEKCEQYEKNILELAKRFNVENIEDMKGSLISIDVEDDKETYEYDQWVIRRNLDTIIKKLNGKINIHNAAKIVDSENAVYNEDKEEISLEYITDIDTIIELFHITQDGLNDLVEDKYQEWAEEIISDYINNNVDLDISEGNGTALGSISAVLDDWMNISSNVHGSSYKQWNIIPDGTPGVDAEITSPIDTVQGSLSSLKSVFEMIENNDTWISTTSDCGLHINIGSWTKEEVNKIDWLKFLILVKADIILKEFQRQSNRFAINTLPNIISSLKGENDIKTYFDSIEKINKFVFTQDKFTAINFIKLNSSTPHIEIRAFGNTDYHLKFDKVKEYVLRVIRALEIASDPNAYKKEYINMLYKLFGDKYFDKSNKKNPETDDFDYSRTPLIYKFYELWDGKLHNLNLKQIHDFGGVFKRRILDICADIRYSKNKEEEIEIKSIEQAITKEMIEVFMKLKDITINPKDTYVKSPIHPEYMKEIKKYPKINYMIKQIMGN